MVEKEETKKRKKIALTLGQLEPFLVALSELAGKDIPAAASYRLGKFLKTVNEEYKQFNEARRKLVNKYAEKDKEGNPKFDKQGRVDFGENREAADREAQELAEQKVSFFPPAIKLSDLGDVKIKPRSMALLGDIFEDD